MVEKFSNYLTAKRWGTSNKEKEQARSWIRNSHHTAEWLGHLLQAWHLKWQNVTPRRSDRHGTSIRAAPVHLLHPPSHADVTNCTVSGGHCTKNCQCQHGDTGWHFQAELCLPSCFDNPLSRLPHKQQLFLQHSWKKASHWLRSKSYSDFLGFRRKITTRAASVRCLYLPTTKSDSAVFIPSVHHLGSADLLAVLGDFSSIFKTLFKSRPDFSGVASHVGLLQAGRLTHSWCPLLLWPVSVLKILQRNWTFQAVALPSRKKNVKTAYELGTHLNSTQHLFSEENTFLALRWLFWLNYLKLAHFCNTFWWKPILQWNCYTG